MSYALLDIGNSATKLSKLNHGTLTRVMTCPTKDLPHRMTELNLETYEACAISSVVPTLDSLFTSLTNVSFVTHLTIPKIKTNLKNPEQIGADLLANALGALTTYSLPALIISSGTAITCSVVDETGTYQGALIFPGMGIASQALNDYTAKIPLIHVTHQDIAFGKNTQEAVESGLYHGYIALINGFIAHAKKSYPSAMVIGTGNGLEILKDKLHLDVHDPDLIMKGLQEFMQSKVTSNAKD